MSWHIILLRLGCSALGAFFVGILARFGKFQRHIGALQYEVYRSGLEARANISSTEEEIIAAIATLPICVQKFLKQCVTDTKRLPPTIILEQEIFLKFSKDGQWVGPMRSTQHFSPHTPGFVFSGSLPLYWVTGYECMLHGEGSTQWRVFGLLTVSKHSGGILNKAGRLRYLSEMIYYPAALLPSPWLQWEAVEGNPNRK